MLFVFGCSSQTAGTDYEGIIQGMYMSAVHGNAQTIIDDCDNQTIILNERTQLFPSFQPKEAREAIAASQTIIQPHHAYDVTRILDTKALKEFGNIDPVEHTQIAGADSTEITVILKPDTEKTVVRYAEKTRILRPPEQAQQQTQISDEPDLEARNDLLTQFDGSHHSNSVGLKAARELLENALKDKGKILNKRFVLEGVLGIGGMGVVYLTRDLRRVEAEDPFPYVATKVLNDDFKNHPDAFVALQQEAVKSQMLSHPNIVTVYDFDRDGNTLYMTMELLRGNPLDRLIKQHYSSGMPLDEAITIFNGLCDGLSFAHKNNLIHSDFKPMNVFVTFGQVAKILDFGIARVCSDNDVKFSKFDAGNLGAITPEYASLEMIQKKKPTFSDDIFALACVFYLTLSGKHPYNKVPAHKALKKKLKPERIKCLSNSQWKALEKGLALEGKNRFQSVDEFNMAFHHTPRFSRTLGISMATLSSLLIIINLVQWLV